MEHPLIGDLKDLSIEDLQNRINELNKKYVWALRNNAYLAQQISMALESYHACYQTKQQEIEDAARRSGGPDYSNKIDIS